MLERPLERVLTVDLFEPPQRIQYREQVVARRARGETEREVARALGITVTAAQRAAALERLMKQQGLAEPYLRLKEPSADYGRIRRHLHPRYRFEPLPDYTPDW